MATVPVLDDPPAVSRARTFPQSHGRCFLFRVVARVLALLFILFPTVIVTTGNGAAHAAPAVLVAPAVAAALPFSVVSAGVGGGAFLLSPPAALASASLTAAAALAANWAVDMLWKWGADTPLTYGDPPPPVSTGLAGCVNTSPVSTYAWCGSTLSVYKGLNSSTLNMMSIRVHRSGPIAGHPKCSGSWGTRYINNAPPLYPGGNGTTDRGPLEIPCPAGTTIEGVFIHGGLEPPSSWWVAFYPNATATNSPTTEPGRTPLTVTPKTTCKVNGTNDTSEISGIAETVTRAGSTGGVLRFPACPSGSTMIRRAAPVTRTNADGTVETIGNAVGEPANDDWGDPYVAPWTPPAVPATYADCSQRACVMILTRTLPDGTLITCSQAGMCVSYRDVVQQYPEVGTNAFTGPRTAPDGSSYQCKFGPYPVAVAECQVIPWAGIGAENDTTNQDGCTLDMSWNPISWVLEPVKCALTWAFKPSASAATGWQTRINDIKGRFPVNVMVGGVDSINTVVDNVGTVSPSACNFSFDTPNGVEFDPMCEAAEQMQTNARGQMIYRLMQISIIGAFAWWTWRRIAASFGGKESTDT